MNNTEIQAAQWQNVPCMLTGYKLTVYATEVEEVGSAVHLVELEAHLGLHPSHGILPPHAQIIRIHNLEELRRGEETTT